MREPILLIGGGGHCHSVIDVLVKQNKYAIYGIVDQIEKVGTSIMGFPVIGTDDDLSELFRKCTNAIITVGQIRSHELRERLYKTVKDIGYNLPVIVSPLAYVSPFSKIGEGSVVMHHSLVNANVEIGVNCILNTKSLIEHDCKVGDHCHISTASILNGGVRVKNYSFIGSNAIIAQGAIVEGFIKAGSISK